MTVIHAAAGASHCHHVLDLLLNPGYGVDIDAKDRHGRTSLHRASLSGILKNILCLLNANASLNTKDSCGETALHLACDLNSLQVISLLIKFTSIDATNDRCQTPLHIASRPVYCLF